MKPSDATFMELYGRGGIVCEADKSRRDLNVKGLAAFDIRTAKPNGKMWDFNNRGDRKLAMDIIDKENPDFVVGSPACTAYCSWNQHLNSKHMPKGGAII